MPHSMLTGNNQSIGVFDSGLGGLSVLRSLRRLMPGESFIYFGDTARAPYGNRSPEEIRRFNREIGAWLLSTGCKMLVVACNTSTVLGMGEIKAMTDKPVVGMMEATLQAALPQDRADEDQVWPMGFIATRGTVSSMAYQKAFSDAAGDKGFYAVACPALVPLVEAGITEGAEIQRCMDEYISPLVSKGIRSLILGCTHYPFLSEAIGKYVGAGVRLIDPAESVALIARKYLADHGVLSEDHANARLEFFCSGSTENFIAVGSALWGSAIREVRRKAF